MSNTSKNAVLKAIVNAVITELMIKTNGEQVYLDENTTLTPKIAEMVAAINLRAKSADVKDSVDKINAAIDELNAAVKLKAEDSDVNEYVKNLTASIDELNAAVSLKAESTDVNKLVSDLRQEMLGDVPVEAYNTFTELAAYISEHEEISDALTEAIGLKADKTTVDELAAALKQLDDVAIKNEVTEDDLGDELSTKIANIVSTLSKLGALANKDEIAEDDLDTELSTKWSKVVDAVDNLGSLATKNEVTEEDLNTELQEKVNAAAEGNHSHNNKSVLDEITNDRVAEWDEKTKLYIDKTKPESLKNSDLWFHTI